MKKILTMALIAVACMGCTSHQKAEKIDKVIKPVAVGSTAFIPKATAFKMSGAYADKVAVTLDYAGNLVYYPAPGDITKASAPSYLGNGWWLNNQGISAGSVFTCWSFDEYAALKEVPSVQDIKAHIIPGAHVTRFFRTSVPVTKVSDNLAKIKAELGAESGVD